MLWVPRDIFTSLCSFQIRPLVFLPSFLLWSFPEDASKGRWCLCSKYPEHCAALVFTGSVSRPLWPPQKAAASPTPSEPAQQLLWLFLSFFLFPLWCGPFEKSSEFVTILFLAYVWCFGHKAYEILTPHQDRICCPLHESPTTGLPEKSPFGLFFPPADHRCPRSQVRSVLLQLMGFELSVPSDLRTLHQDLVKWAFSFSLTVLGLGKRCSQPALTFSSN